MNADVMHDFMSGIVAIAILVAFAVAAYIVACVIAWTAKDMDFGEFFGDKEDREDK